MRIFLLHHVTWSINSVCHFFGARRFDDRRRVAQRLLARAAVARRGLAPQPPRLPDAPPSTACAAGRARRPGGLLIAGMEKVGLVWNVVRVSPERQERKALAGGVTSPAGRRLRRPEDETQARRTGEATGLRRAVRRGHRSDAASAEFPTLSCPCVPCPLLLPRSPSLLLSRRPGGAPAGSSSSTARCCATPATTSSRATSRSTTSVACCARRERAAA